MKKINDYFLYIVLLVSFVFLILYLISYNFRQFLSCLKIDPNFLVAFISAVTLIVSTISIKKEREYNYNLNLKNSTETKVELVVGKLLRIMNDSERYLTTIKEIDKSIKENKKFVDLNNILSLVSLNESMEIAGSYITIYFSSYILDDWNSLQEKINKIAHNCSNLLVNYNENHHLINENNFQNEVLSKVTETIKESEDLNKEIYELSKKMKNLLLINILKHNQDKIKEKYIN